MSAQCPHNILRRIYMSHEGDVGRTLCGHISPGIYVCPHNVRTISFFGFQLCIIHKFAKGSVVVIQEFFLSLKALMSMIMLVSYLYVNCDLNGCDGYIIIIVIVLAMMSW